MSHMTLPYNLTYHGSPKKHLNNKNGVRKVVGLAHVKDPEGYILQQHLNGIQKGVIKSGFQMHIKSNIVSALVLLSFTL